MTALQADVLVEGLSGEGPTLILSAPISFWGGVDPATGLVIDARHPDRGKSIAATVLFLPGTIGSSSASSVMLELIRAGLAPAALVVHEPDAILLLGLIVAREMGWPPPIAVRLDRAHFQKLAGKMVRVVADGTIETV